MKTSKSAVIVLMFILMLSIFVANVVNLINVDSSNVNSASSQKTSDSNGQHWHEPKKFEIQDSFQHLMWFLQVSFGLQMFSFKILFLCYLEMSF